MFFRPDDPGTEYYILADLAERIMPGAFDRALRDGDDVRAAFNHNVDYILGRTTAGTLALVVDPKGLFYAITPPDTDQARTVIEAIGRGDVTGSSFTFEVESQVWREEFDPTTEQTIIYREIESVRLYECGPVVFPAYSATQVGIRSDGHVSLRSIETAGLHREAIAARDAWIAAGKPAVAEQRKVNAQRRQAGYQRRVAEVLGEIAGDVGVVRYWEERVEHYKQAGDRLKMIQSQACLALVGTGNPLPDYHRGL